MFDYSILLATITIILLFISILFMLILPNKTYFIEPNYLKKINIHKYKFNKIRSELLPILNDIEWRRWYIKEQTTDDVFYYPIKMFGNIWNNNYEILKDIIPDDLINDVNISSIYLLKIDINNYFKYSIDDMKNVDKNIKFIIPVDYYKGNNKCGVWVNNHIRSASGYNKILFDNSIDFSYFNNSLLPMYLLCMDVKRLHDLYKPQKLIPYNKNAKLQIKQEIKFLKKSEIKK